MRYLVSELMLIEDKAAAFYRAMAGYFQDNPSVALALNDLAEDEEYHSKIMNIVAMCMGEEEILSFPLELNQSTLSAIRNTVDTCLSMARAGNLSLRKLAEAIVEIEFSEWNSLFFYVVNALKDENQECKLAAIKLQGHIRKIQRFLEQLPLDSDVLAKIRNLPPLWSENILVIDDQETVRELLKAVLNSMGNVEVASSGPEGLDKIMGKYYALVVSDIAMPGYDGIELFERAFQQFPSIGKRFLFFSAVAAEDKINFVKKHNLELLSKPARINEIVTKASAILAAPSSTV
ncbi:MAG TPA: response regulator [Thermodesulfovibrionales bacterium]|nr:response regulator [Thermodesulfovibrionales bacterium]